MATSSPLPFSHVPRPKWWPLIATLTCNAGCGLSAVDVTGIDKGLCASCGELGGSGGGGTTQYMGVLAIGPYGAELGEAMVYLYDPADTVSPIDSAAANGGRYVFGFGGAPPSAVCGYLVRAVLWTGDSSGIAPFLPTLPASCDPPPPVMKTHDFHLAYEPLDEPFTLTGVVLVDGVPASGIRVDIHVRPATTEWSPGCEGASFYRLQPEKSLRYVRPPVECVPVETDDTGTYTYSTADRAQWYVLCELASARATLDDGRTWITGLESTPRSSCAHRRLPDLRFGGLEIAKGLVAVSGEGRWAVAGEAYAEVLDPVDSTAIGEGAWTLDDGTFHLWYPDDLGEPPCDLLLRVALTGGGTETRRLMPGATGATCGGGAYLHWFELPGSPG